MAKANRWYAMQAKTVGAEVIAEIRIYAEIGFWGMTASDFITQLDAVAVDATRLVVSINSPGGDVFDAFAIYNALRRYAGKIDTRVDGIAASAASLILMAGDRVIMPENAMVMIHNAWIITGGTASDLRTTADMMDKARDGIVAAYAQKSGLDDAKIIEMLDATTWMSALDAQALGFCDLIEQPIKLAASDSAAAILSKHKNLPAEVQALIDEASTTAAAEAAGESAQDPARAGAANAPPAATAPAAASDAAAVVVATAVEAPAATPTGALCALIFAACRKEGIPHLAEGILQSGGLVDQAQADARVAAAKEIAGACLAAKLPDMAADFVATGLSVDQVRARLFNMVMKGSTDRVNNLHHQDTPALAAGGPNARTIYAARMAAAAPHRQ
jgi:ATP-dependent protease ClpP protease subunit